MSFKIVQEYNKTTLKIIPEGLEKNGVFWYPPASLSTKQRNNVLKNKFALPDKTLWEAIPCVVKRNRIDTYELAEEFEEKILQSFKPNADGVFVVKSEESSDEEKFGSIKKRKKSKLRTNSLPTPAATPTRRSRNSEPALESVSESVSELTPELAPAAAPAPKPMPTQKPAPSAPAPASEPAPAPAPVVDEFNESLWACFDTSTTLVDFKCRLKAFHKPPTQPVIAPPTVDPTPRIGYIPRRLHEPEIKPEKKVPVERDLFLDCESECDSLGFDTNEKSDLAQPETTNLLLKILKKQEEHQNEISKKLNEVKTYIQEGLSKVFTELETLTQIQYSNSLSSVNPDIYPKKFCIENFKKVSTCEEANRLEKMLMISEFKADMVAKMSNIIGNNAKRIGEGLNCCYDLLETVFQRKFLKICSWTGQSTSQMEEGKIAFLKYKNIISFFASVIVNADPEFSLEETKLFFKDVLRNSSKFLNQNNRDSNRERISRKRQAPSPSDDEDSLKKSTKRKKALNSPSESCEIEKVPKDNNPETDSLLAEKNIENILNDTDALQLGLIEEDANLEEPNAATTVTEN